MKKTLFLALLLQAVLIVAAQENKMIVFPAADSIPPKDKASAILSKLKGDGIVIVRLKTNQKSVDAYRKAGQEDIASRIEDDRKRQNMKIYNAFIRNFTFCKVYFIYASDTKKMLDGERVFLKVADRSIVVDHKIAFTIDPSLSLPDDNYVFCEYGSGEPFSDFKQQRYVGVSSGGTPVPVPGAQRIFDSIPPKTTTDPASTSAMVFYDKDLNQLKRPFPFMEGVYLDGYEATVRSLNSQLLHSYYRLVTRPAVREKVKGYKQKAKPGNAKGH